jgi:hypothetical protein
MGQVGQLVADLVDAFDVHAFSPLFEGADFLMADTWTPVCA